MPRCSMGQHNGSSHMRSWLLAVCWQKHGSSEGRFFGNECLHIAWPMLTCMVLISQRKFHLNEIFVCPMNFIVAGFDCTSVCYLWYYILNTLERNPGKTLAIVIYMTPVLTYFNLGQKNFLSLSFISSPHICSKSSRIKVARQQTI